MRFEARHSLPLQPRIESSTPAATSRERNASHLSPFTATEDLRTGNEGLFSRLRSELVQAKYVIPDTYLPTDPNQPITVVIASSNQRKIDTMLAHVNTHRLDAFRVEEAAHSEAHSGMVDVDAASKAIKATELIQEGEDESRREVRKRPHVSIATDQMNAIPLVVEDQKTGLEFIEFHRLGKPKTDAPENAVGSVQEMFATLAATAKAHNWATIPYLIELATVIHNPTDNSMAISIQKIAACLSVDGVESLATKRFDEYVERAQQQTGITNGKAGVSDIAGGLEFAVLDAMGIVEFVSGTLDEIQTTGFPPQQRPDAKEHAYRLALGDADGRLIQDYFTKTSN